MTDEINPNPADELRKGPGGPIDARPTKEFFIYMLTRDVPLIRSIIDLVDNSVDGALRCSRNQSDFSDFFVTLEMNGDHFRIVDNCGGIPIKTAREYAFRFGRPVDVPNEAGSIGQFGVGMKRTIFKLGNEFKIQSTTKDSHFVIQEDVEEWKTDELKWHFDFKDLQKGKAFPPEKRGTILEVTRLHKSNSDDFKLELFIETLSKEMRVAHAPNIARGLSISINGVPLQATELSLLDSETLKPANFSFEIPVPSGEVVRVKIIAGIAEERSLVKGGWYVFCNGRLILSADQSEVTGWETEGDDDENRPNMPKYHADFAYFRGFVFFESDNPSLLPWTTTKTGVDVDSPIFKAARLRMVQIARPIATFLRHLAEEKRAKELGEQDETPLANALKSAVSVSHTVVSAQAKSNEATFEAPRPAVKRIAPLTTRAQYDAKISDLNRAKARLGVNSAKEVGLKTFDYYLQAECDE